MMMTPWALSLHELTTTAIMARQFIYTHVETETDQDQVNKIKS